MQNIEREQSLPKRLAQQLELRWDALFNDLSLFASLCLARLIVRRTLRRQRQERIERLKHFQLAPARDEACE